MNYSTYDELLSANFKFILVDIFNYKHFLLYNETVNELYNLPRLISDNEFDDLIVNYYKTKKLKFSEVGFSHSQKRKIFNMILQNNFLLIHNSISYVSNLNTMNQCIIRQLLNNPKEFYKMHMEDQKNIAKSNANIVKVDNNAINSWKL